MMDRYQFCLVLFDSESLYLRYSITYLTEFPIFLDFFGLSVSKFIRLMKEFLSH